MSENEPPDDNTDAHAIDVILSQAAQQHPTVVVVGGSSAGRVFRIAGELIVGRGAEAHIRLEDEGVSRKHLRLRSMSPNEVEATDLGSTNGTYCNGELVNTRRLQAGDRLQVGPIALLKFQYQDELEQLAQTRLYEAVTRDPVTQLRNKQFFLEELDREFAVFVRHATPLSLLMIEVDGYEATLAREGRAMTDRMLQRVAAAISGRVRVEDVVARYSDERFAVVLRNTAAEAAISCAEGIRAAVLNAAAAQPQTAAGQFSVTIGAASAGKRSYATADALLTVARDAVVDAARRGQNHVWHAEALAPTPAQQAATARERRTQVRLAVPLNARIVTGTQEVEYSVRDVSMSGIYLFAAAAPAPVGSNVTLKLALTAGIKAITVTAEVLRISGDAKGAVSGVALEFLPVEQAQKAQLLDLLDRAMSGRGTASRAFPRVYPLIEIDCRDVDDFRAVLRDISEGGVGLLVDRKLELNQELELNLQRPPAPPLKVKGWPVSVEAVAEHPGWFRAGIRFSRLAPDVRLELQKLLKGLYRR